jgi:hypothetical protein
LIRKKELLARIKKLEEALRFLNEQTIKPLEDRVKQLEPGEIRKALGERNKQLVDDFLLPGIRKEMLEYYKKMEGHINKVVIQATGTIEAEKDREKAQRDMISDIIILKGEVGRIMLYMGMKGGKGWEDPYAKVDKKSK